MNMSLWFNAFGHRHFTVPPFHCPIVPPCRNFTRRRGHRANNLLCDLKHRSTVPAATPSHRATWDTVQPCHMPHRPIEQLSTLSKRPTVPPFHRLTVPPSHRSTCNYHAATVSPWHLVRHCGSVPPSYRHVTFDTSAYLRTPTHLSYFSTHLTFGNNTSVPFDTVCFFHYMVCC